MRKWPLILLHAMEAAVVLTVLYHEPTYCVRGILWREAFYDGKPTSYWSAELEHWDVSPLTLYLSGIQYAGKQEDGTQVLFYQRTPGWFERQRERWFPPQPKAAWNINQWFVTPPILNGGDDAAPVLRELLNDRSPKVCQFARTGLGLDAVK